MIRFGGQGDKRGDKSAEGEEEGRQARERGKEGGRARLLQRAVFTRTDVLLTVSSYLCH